MKSNLKHKKYHASSKDRESFTSSLAMQIKAGVIVGDALESLRKTSSSKAMKNAIAQMLEDIDSGISLSGAMQASGVVGEQTQALTRLGEQSGNLAENLAIAATQEEKQRIFRSKVRTALLYPLFVLTLSLVIALGVSWLLLPRLADTFESLNVELPWITQTLINFGELLKTDGYWLVPLLFVSLFAIGYIIFKAPKTKVIGQSILLHIPGIGRLLTEVEVARFGYLMGVLLKAGLSITSSLQLMSESTTLRRYQKIYLTWKENFDEGYNFATNFEAGKKVNKLFPPSVQQIVIAGEKSGSLAESLQTVGEAYEQKADATTNNLQAILEPILLVFVWIGVLGVAVAVIIPIYSLVGELNG